MTTKVTIDAHAGWPVRVTPIGGNYPVQTVEPNTVREFSVHSGTDLLIQELPKLGAIPAGQDIDDPILRFFAFGHLPPHLQAASGPFCHLANLLVASLPKCAERSVALRKLLEAKDAAVRAALEAPRQS